MANDKRVTFRSCQNGGPRGMKDNSRRRFPGKTGRQTARLARAEREAKTQRS